VPSSHVDPAMQTTSSTSARAFRASLWPVVGLIVSLPFWGPSFTSAGHAQMPPPTQFDVQAVYLFDFAKFVRWPAGREHDTLTFCIAGERRYAESLARIVEGEHIGERPLSARIIERPENVSGCDVLFISDAAKDRLDEFLAASARRPMLTVSDIPAFLERGGMIKFLPVGNRIRFSVDLRSVSQGGISLSSELLKVAVSVNGKPAGGGGQ